MHFKMTPAINLSIIAQNAVRLVRTSPLGRTITIFCKMVRVDICFIDASLLVQDDNISCMEASHLPVVFGFGADLSMSATCGHGVCVALVMLAQ